MAGSTTFNPDPDRLVYHPHGYDPEELIKMQSWALRRFYLRPRQILRQVRRVRPSNVRKMADVALSGFF